MLATALVVACGAAFGIAQQPDLAWAEGLSEVPLVDLSGTWRFDPAGSDPLIEDWREIELECRIFQQADRIVLQFAPGDRDHRVVSYRWDGSVRAERRDSTEVRERARWTEGGRTLEVEGRWWQVGDQPAIQRYVHRYRSQGQRVLVMTLEDEFGATTWRFERSGRP